MFPKPAMTQGQVARTIDSMEGGDEPRQPIAKEVSITPQRREDVEGQAVLQDENDGMRDCP